MKTRCPQYLYWRILLCACLFCCSLVGLNLQTQYLQAETAASITYDDSATPPLVFTGNWTYSNNSPNAMMSTLHWSNVAGNSVVLNFSGSTITRFYSMANNRGSETVFIDGVLKGVYSSYAPETRRQIGRTWSGLSTGSHTIEVRVNSGGYYSDIDAFAVDIAAVGEGVYDNSHTHVRYFGSWSDSSYTVGTYDNSLKISNSPQSGFRFAFTGDAITYIYSTSANRGRAAITIDGNNYGYIDQYSPDLRRQISKRFSGLGSGIHVINVVATGEKNPSSTDYYVDLDALIVGNVYNSGAAVAYADTWAHGRNNNYPDYGTGDNCNDCTNFVSQVLESGGMPRIEHTNIDNQYYWYVKTVWWQLAGSRSWAATDWFKLHADSFSTRYQYASSGPSVLQGGDFFLMDLRSEISGPDHARVVVGWGYPQEGDQTTQYALLASQHCTDRKRVRWNYLIDDPSVTKWAYRVIY